MASVDALAIAYQPRPQEGRRVTAKNTNRKPTPSQGRLRELLDYDPATGIFRWREKSHSMSRILAGTIAGSISSQGYWQIHVLGYQFKAHQLAWVIMTGAWPETPIDHKNRIRHDNRWENLRLATVQQNNQNCSLSVRNTSGIKGVSYNKRDGVWHAYINHNGKRHHLGSFASKEDAAKRYELAAIDFFGEFSGIRGAP